MREKGREKEMIRCRDRERKEERGGKEMKRERTFTWWGMILIS